MIYDVAIIGGGPVGIFSVFANGMQNLSCVIIDALDKLGGQCACLYPEKYIYDIPAFDKITAKELIERLQQQALAFEPNVVLNSFVKNVEHVGNAFCLHLETTHDTHHENRKNTIHARAIIVALGSGLFQPLKLPHANAPEFEGKNIFYFLDDITMFKDKIVTIVGAGDSAVDWALMLADVAAKVYLVHRRDYVKAHPSSWVAVQKLAACGKIEIKIPYTISELASNAGKFEGVRLQDSEQRCELLKCDYLLPCFGLKSDLGFLADWHLNLSNCRIVVDPTNMRTSIDGIYAIGDCVEYANKRKLIITGFSEAMQAAVDIRAYLYPDKAPIIGHSTTLGVPHVG